MEWGKKPVIGDHKGRFGVMDMRSLLAQANVAHSEFSPGEDKFAVDVTLSFEAGSVRVQVKTGTTVPNRDGSITVGVEEPWRRKWSRCRLPVYLVYIRVEKPDPLNWIEHADLHTLVHARAHWVRVNHVLASSVRVPKSNRLSVTTFSVWSDDFDADWKVARGTR